MKSYQMHLTKCVYTGVGFIENVECFKGPESFRYLNTISQTKSYLKTYLEQSKIT